MSLTRLKDITKYAGIRFRFQEDIDKDINVEYMIMRPEGDDYWITPIINIQPDNAFVGTISKFKSDDGIMENEVILSKV
jgi:hypothetical protein